MRTLRLVALSDDGRSVVLAADGPDGEGERFQLPIDDRLRAAARGDSRRLTQIDVDQGTELPPRIIQSRIRAGETPEQVAAASGTRVERIMRFAHPVIQERARVAEQARDARVRLSEGSPTVALQQFMIDRLRLIDADHVEAVTWDAYRSDDGRTSGVTVSWTDSWTDSCSGSRTTATPRRPGAGTRPAGTSGTTLTRRVPSAKSVVAASDGATVREGMSKLQRVVPDFSPDRQAPVTCQLPSSLR